MANKPRWCQDKTDNSAQLRHNGQQAEMVQYTTDNSARLKHNGQQAEMVPRQNTATVMLNQDFLCSSYVSKVCQKYPRKQQEFETFNKCCWDTITDCAAIHLLLHRTVLAVTHWPLPCASHNVRWKLQIQNAQATSAFSKLSISLYN